MAEPSFDRSAFGRRLVTHRLGRALVVRDRVDSTNDVAWEALGEGAPDGSVVVADAQEAGRGRLGRVWHTSPGRALALSLTLNPARVEADLGLVPLAAGLALARAVDGLGLRPRLKWPNDLLVGARKLAGILVESRSVPGDPVVAGRAIDAPRSSGEGRRAVVVGVGVNVGQARHDFPPELRNRATSLSLEGCAAGREVVAAGFLNAFEPLWDELLDLEGGGILQAWSARADFWGRTVTVRGPGGTVRGIARGLDEQGGLVLGTGRGQTVVHAGDLEIPEAVPGPGERGGNGR